MPLALWLLLELEPAFSSPQARLAKQHEEQKKQLRRQAEQQRRREEQDRSSQPSSSPTSQQASPPATPSPAGSVEDAESKQKQRERQRQEQRRKREAVSARKPGRVSHLTALPLPLCSQMAAQIDMTHQSDVMRQFEMDTFS